VDLVQENKSALYPGSWGWWEYEIRWNS